MEQQTYTYKYPRPAVTTDCVVFGFDKHDLKVLLIERGGEPFKGKWALPGGFLNMDETAEEGAKRELKEETGLEVQNVELVSCFSEPDRDPRGRTISIAFFTVTEIQEPQAGDDASKARWFNTDELPPLAFDHDEILQMAIKKLKESNLQQSK